MEDVAEQYASGRTQEVLTQVQTQNWRRFLSYEDREVRAKYPELDKNNTEKFHPALANAMSMRYLRMVGWTPGDPQRGIPESVKIPDISYTEFVDSEMEYINEAASLKAAASTNNTTRQVANTGLRPDGSSARAMDLGKAPQDMTNEELEAAINVTMPRDVRGRFTSR
jgi:hypothetical protein